MKGYVVTVEKEILHNKDFRRVLYTGKHSQHVHAMVDQFFRFEKGEGTVVIDGIDNRRV